MGDTTSDVPDGGSSTPQDTELAVTSTAATAPASADIAQLVNRIDRSIKARRESDQTFINYWLYLFVVSWVTLGIYGIVLYYRRMARIDRFSERKLAYYRALTQWTERYSQQQGAEDSVHHLLGDMSSEIAAAEKGDLRQINATVSLLLTFVTLGFYGLWVTYRMNRYWWDAQVAEQEFDDKLSQAWANLGLMRYPISYSLDQSKRRSYPLYLVLSIVTFGIWGIVWDYKIHTDPDHLYGEFHSVEDTVLQTVRAH
jgi:hypothetical protein